MFLNRRTPDTRPGTSLQRMRLPSQTSPRNPHTLPSFATNENPSPLLRTVLRLAKRTWMPSFPTAVTLPISSPMDFAASRQAHEPLFPSMNSSVYPLLNVLRVSGMKPPVTLPNEPLTYSPARFDTISSRAME